MVLFNVNYYNRKSLNTTNNNVKMNGSKLDLSGIIGREHVSLADGEAKIMYEILYGAGENEIVRSPYEIDRDKTVFRTRQQISLEGIASSKGTYEYRLTETDDGKKHVMDLASKMFLHDTIPAVSVKDEFRETTQICHCRYPGHVKIEEAHLYHGNDQAQTIDNVVLDQYAEFNISADKRAFYRKMVGDTESNTTWSLDLASFSISVPQPWYFCTIPGAELRLNAKTPTKAIYSYREEPSATLRMRIRDDANSPWREVNVEENIERIKIETIGKKKTTFEMYMVTHKVHEQYAKQLEEAPFSIPYDDVIILDSVDDRNTHEINISSVDFARRICILAEPKNLPDKSLYEDAIVSGKLEYGSGHKKIPLLTPYQLLYDDIWSSSFSLPDRNNFYMLTFSDSNKPGSYDSSTSLGALKSKLTLLLDKSNTYNLKVRLYVYRVILYKDNAINVVYSLNASNFNPTN